MHRRWPLKKIHGRFLDSCRTLADARAEGEGLQFARWVLRILAPVPLPGPEDDGGPLAGALDWLEARCRETPLSEDVIRDYHRRLDPGSAGAYRTRSVYTVGSDRPPPSPAHIHRMMKRWSERLAVAQARLDATPNPFEAMRLAVDAYQRIGFIHPFPDGNARVSRLAMNHLLRRYGLGYVVFPPLSESEDLQAALREGQRGRLTPLLELAEKNLHAV